MKAEPAGNDNDDAVQANNPPSSSARTSPVVTKHGSATGDKPSPVTNLNGGRIHLSDANSADAENTNRGVDDDDEDRLYYDGGYFHRPKYQDSYGSQGSRYPSRFGNSAYRNDFNDNWWRSGGNRYQPKSYYDYNTPYYEPIDSPKQPTNQRASNQWLSTQQSPNKLMANRWPAKSVDPTDPPVRHTAGNSAVVNEFSFPFYSCTSVVSFLCAVI